MKASLLARLALAGTCAFVFGCSSSSDTQLPPADSGGQTDTGGTTQDTGATPETPADVGGPVTLDCNDYCTKNLAICTGPLKQYIDDATCLAMCAKIPVGKASDTSGDSLGCRAYHTSAAGGLNPGTSPDPNTHCTHSGAYGGTVCGDTRCADFCELALAQCGTVTGTPFNDTASCMTMCNAAQPFDATIAELSPSAAGKMNCLEYHLEAAYTDPTTHCKHLTTAKGAASPCASP